MNDLTEKLPKCLTRIGGRSLLEWQLAAIHSAGIKDVAIVTGYQRDALEHFGLTEFHNFNWSQTNMVMSLACATPWLSRGPCIVSYSDIFYDSSAIRLLKESRSSLAITFDPEWRALWRARFGDPLVDAETFRITSNGFLREIGKKPVSLEEIEGQFMGLIRFTPESWQEAQTLCSQLNSIDRDRLDMTSLLNGLLARERVQISALPYSGEWGEVDSQSDLELYVTSQFRLFGATK